MPLLPPIFVEVDLRDFLDRRMDQGIPVVVLEPCVVQLDQVGRSIGLEVHLHRG